MDFRKKIDELNQIVVELEHEIQLKNETITVNNMLHDDFRERMVDKYWYDTDDELSDYEPNEEA